MVVPNVVKTNWAREVELWTPKRTATVVHGDGNDVDAFSDVVIVNYEVLDRHVGWLSRFGFKGMVVDEAHFIKNLQVASVPSTCSHCRSSIRALQPEALMMALTGTPLINDIEDFRAIWQFLGWIDDKKPLPLLMDKLEETGLTPADFGFFAEARRAVIEMGIVRRKKVDVAADIPARRIADMPVELDDDSGRAASGQRRRPSWRACWTSTAACAQLKPDAGARRPDSRRSRTPNSKSRRAAKIGRERLHHGAQDRPGQGRARCRLHGSARPRRSARWSSSRSTST